MTLDEAIEHEQLVADTNCDQCAEDHRQLAEWLKELKKLRKHGWHPASESPVIPEGQNWVEVIALVDYGDGQLRPKHEIYKDTGWVNIKMWTIKWWCYPPEED